MKRQEILEAIRLLARAQGFYGRLYERLLETQQEDYDTYDEFMQALERLDFKDSLDLVMYLEG